MSPKLAAACTFVALSVSPCFGQGSGGPGADPNRFSLSSTVRRAWQEDASGLMELIAAKHPRGASRCWTQKGKIDDRIVVLLQAQVHGEHQQPVGPHPERHRLHLPQTVQEQRGAGEHDERQAHLAYHEQVAKQVPRGAGGRAALLE